MERIDKLKEVSNVECYTVCKHFVEKRVISYGGKKFQKYGNIFSVERSTSKICNQMEISYRILDAMK